MGVATLRQPEVAQPDAALVFGDDGLALETPADLPRRVAGDDVVGCHIRGHHRTGGDDGATADPHPRQHEATESQPDVTADAHDIRVRIDAGRHRHHRRRDLRREAHRHAADAEIMVLPPDQRHAVGDQREVPDLGVALDVHILADDMPKMILLPLKGKVKSAVLFDTGKKISHENVSGGVVLHTADLTPAIDRIITLTVK